jgi:hypothetical protein
MLYDWLTSHNLCLYNYVFLLCWQPTFMTGVLAPSLSFWYLAAFEAPGTSYLFNTSLSHWLWALRDSSSTQLKHHSHIQCSRQRTVNILCYIHLFHLSFREHLWSPLKKDEHEGLQLQLTDYIVCYFLKKTGLFSSKHFDTLQQNRTQLNIVNYFLPRIIKYFVKNHWLLHCYPTPDMMAFSLGLLSTSAYLGCPRG